MKDIEAGTKTNTRFRTDEKIERAYVEQREMQYLYQDGDSYVFMDKDTYEQLTLSAEMLEGQTGYLLPNTDVQINFHNERPIGVAAPAVGRADRGRDRPDIKNSTATDLVQAGEDRDRPRRSGSAVHRNGEKIKVNTDDGAYIERA